MRKLTIAALAIAGLYSFGLGWTYRTQERSKEAREALRSLSPPTTLAPREPSAAELETELKRLMRSKAYELTGFVSEHKNKSFLQAYRKELGRIFFENLAESAVYYPGSSCNERAQWAYAHAYRAVDPAGARAASGSINGVCFHGHTKKILRGE